MKQILMTFAALFTAVAVNSCCQTPSVTGSWTIESINGVTVNVTEGAEAPYIEFNEEGKVHGYTGCNIMNGSYTLEGEKLTFGNMATTMMAGPEEMMKTEQDVLAAVKDASSVKQEADGTLDILDSDNNVLMVLKKK